MRAVCPSCGAQVRLRDRACGLCGSELSPPDSAAAPLNEARHAKSLPGQPKDQDPSTAPGVYCNQCGWKNAVGSRYCARCGEVLQDLSEIFASEDVDVDSASSQSLRSMLPARRSLRDFKRMSLVVAVGGALLVAALFAMTSFSKRAYAPRPTMQGQVTETASAQLVQRPLALEVRDQARRILESMQGTDGAERAVLLAQLVELYLSHGAFSEAASAQEEVASTLDSPVAWADAGNLFYRSMQEAQGPLKRREAERAISAYTRSLELDPENLDVRTDMATTYLATDNPMEGVRQLRQVLDANPSHVQANFNYGVMLSMIGRRDQAVRQFERVMEIVDPNTETYQQAQSALQELGDS